MRVFTPEISWHNRLPALSLDISRPINEAGNLYRVATGGNDCRVYIWLIDTSSTKSSTSNPLISIRAGLRRHQKSVGAVRFSPQQMLASGDDDGYIYLWNHKIETQDQPAIESNIFLNDDGFEDLELWQQHRVLRGHVEDICDLAWSSDGLNLLSGSVDNSAILWDTVKGTKIWCSDLIKGYVQGVAIDPHSQYLAAISSDRTLRVYSFSDKRLLHATRRMNIKGKYTAFFCDDTVQTFCRRFDFSPDGQFLIAPTSRLQEREHKNASTNGKKNLRNGETHSEQNTSIESKPEVEVIELSNLSDDDAGDKAPTPQIAPPPIEPQTAVQPELKPLDKIEDHQESKISKPINVFLVFKRSSFNKPVHYYPTAREVALCARFSPVLYKLKEQETNFWNIPYRIIFAVATSRSVLIYDSQQSTPIGYVSQIHLARLTDISWSSDGLFLMVSSYDGYSTLITFEQNEFGEVYTGPVFEPVTKSSEEDVEMAINENSGEEKSMKKTSKRGKANKDKVKAKREKLTADKNPQDGKEESQNEVVNEIKQPRKATQKKIVPTRLPESATMWKYVTKKPQD